MQHLSRRIFLSTAFASAASFCLLGASGCRPRSESSAPSDRLAVLAAVDPIAYLIERIGGDRVDVFVLTPQGKDPESFAPTPGALRAVASSRLFFRVGLPIEERFAQNIASIAPNAETIDLRVNLELLADPHEHEHAHADGEHDVAHEDEDGGEHENEHEREREAEALDAHVWTGPANVRVMIEAIVGALSQADPAHADEFAAAAKEFDAELAALQEEVIAKVKPYQGAAFVVFHPAYGYYAREFGLQQRAVELEGRTPRPRDLLALIDEVKKSGVKKLIVQPEFNRSSAQAIADSVGAELVDHSPLQKDYFANIRSLTDAIVGSFGEIEPTAAPDASESSASEN